MSITRPTGAVPDRCWIRGWVEADEDTFSMTGPRNIARVLQRVTDVLMKRA